MEFTKKKMLLAFGVILLLMFSYYIIQSHWTYTRQLAHQEKMIKGKAKAATTCKNFKTIMRCERCPRTELRELVSYCMETGYKERIECDDGKQEFIWCDISPAVEEADFFKFEAVFLFLGLSSYAVVYLRQRKLDRILMDKIHKQISAGL